MIVSAISHPVCAIFFACLLRSMTRRTTDLLASMSPRADSAACEKWNANCCVGGSLVLHTLGRIMRIHNDGNDEPMGLRLKILFHDHSIMLLNLYFCKLLGSMVGSMVFQDMNGWVRYNYVLWKPVEDHRRCPDFFYNKVVLHREQKATYATCTKRVSKSS